MQVTASLGLQAGPRAVRVSHRELQPAAEEGGVGQDLAARALPEVVHRPLVVVLRARERARVALPPAPAYAAAVRRVG